MIAQAFKSSYCTCFDPWGATTPKPPCPEHGDLFTAPTFAAPASERQGTSSPTQPKTLPPMPSSEYTRGRVRGFKEGFDAAVAMLGEP